MGHVLITSRVIGTVVKEPVDMLRREGHTIVEHSFLGSNLNEDILCQLVPGVDAMLVGEDHVTPKVLAAADNLKVISKNGVGTNQIDIEEATRCGVVVTNTPGANADAVADLTIGLILAAARRIPFAHNLTRQGEWEKVIGTEIWEKTIGIVGVGRIGKGVAKRATGFRMKILGYDVYQDQEFARKVGLEYVTLDELIRQSDIVCLHVPLTPETEGMITREHLNMMKKNAYLVNVARGGVVSSSDLYDALTKGELAGAALDVFEEEPPVGNPLLTLDNVVTTSHIGAFTHESMERMGTTAARNIIAVLKGKRPGFVVNPQVFNR